jgi:hypothetical protein
MNSGDLEAASIESPHWATSARAEFKEIKAAVGFARPPRSGVGSGQSSRSTSEHSQSAGRSRRDWLLRKGPCTSSVTPSPIPLGLPMSRLRREEKDVIGAFVDLVQRLKITSKAWHTVAGSSVQSACGAWFGADA